MQKEANLYQQIQHTHSGKCAATMSSIGEIKKGCMETVENVGFEESLWLTFSSVSFSTFKNEGIHTSTGSCCYKINQVEHNDCEFQFFMIS
jgi:hypothetical protein